MEVEFKTHSDFVAACEQFADDLLSFNADHETLTIRITKGTLLNKTRKWITKVAREVHDK